MLNPHFSPVLFPQKQQIQSSSLSVKVAGQSQQSLKVISLISLI